MLTKHEDHGIQVSFVALSLCVVSREAPSAVAALLAAATELAAPSSESAFDDHPTSARLTSNPRCSAVESRRPNFVAKVGGAKSRALAAAAAAEAATAARPGLETTGPCSTQSKRTWGQSKVNEQ